MNQLTCQNFISADRQTAIDSLGNYFSVGEIVGHQDKEAGVAKILSFEAISLTDEIRVHTEKGHCSLDFLEKVLP